MMAPAIFIVSFAVAVLMIHEALLALGLIEK